MKTKIEKMMKIGEWISIEDKLPPTRQLVWLEHYDEADGGEIATLGYMVIHNDPWYPFRNRIDKKHNIFLDSNKQRISEVFNWAKILSPYWLEHIRKDLKL
jgi:hypothetical protein